jgi:hypothetical protein
LVVNSEALADRKKRLSFALLGTLAVADVDRGCFVVARCQRRANTRIHTAAEQHNRPRFLRSWHQKLDCSLMISDC